MMKKFIKVVTASAVIMSLSGCAYQAMFEDIAGGDARVATYEFNPLGFKPGTGFRVDPILLKEITNYNVLLDDFISRTSPNKTHDIIVSGGQDEIMAQWSIYKECTSDTGLFKQTTTLYFNSSEEVLNGETELSAILLQEQWSQTENNNFVKSGTGVEYTENYLEEGDFSIHLLPGNDPNTLQVVFETNGCLPLDEIPAGEIIADVNDPSGTWR